MANRTTGHVVGPPTVPDKPRTDYEADFYTWSMEQARLVREARWTEVDRENVAEEIESLGRHEFNRLESAFRVLLLHMLKWDHQPQRRSRSWTLSIKEQRLEAKNLLADNPGLRPRIAEAVARAYAKATVAAANETGLDESIFPETCPYEFDDIMSREFRP